MNLGFSADHEAMRLEFRKLLARSRPRTAFDAPRDASGIGDASLWQQFAELGWLATAVPEAQGGSGLDPLVLCVLAEEAGCHLAAVPFTASACSFTQGLLALAGVPRPEAAGLALDLLHPCCDLAFDQQSVHVLASGAAARASWEQMVDAHALFV